MGMYDTAYVDCPVCQTLTEIQSKAGPRTLDSWPIDDAPLAVKEDISAGTQYCPKGHAFHILLENVKLVKVVTVEGEIPRD